MTYIVTCRHHVAHKDCPWPECQQILALTEQLAKAKQAERLLNAQRKPKQSGMIKRVAKQEWVGLTDDEKVYSNSRYAGKCAEAWQGGVEWAMRTSRRRRDPS